MTKFSISVLVLAAAAGVVAAVPQPSDKGTATPAKPGAAQPVAPAKGASPKEVDKPKKEVAASLKVGDQAPAIKVDAWVKGEEITRFEPGRVYVIEFWATWHPTSVTAIPQLTKAQADHTDLTVVAVAANERRAKPSADGKMPFPADTRLDGVKEFVKKQGKGMEYRVAFEGDQEMAREWMVAAKRDTLPCAFIVGHEGKLTYIGSPSDMDAELNKALKAAADSKKAAVK